MGILRQICYWSIELQINNFSGVVNSANQLIGHLFDYKKPYEFEYGTGFNSVENCLKIIEQSNNCIQEIA
ncbi:16617_t:CDS:1, partial [Funneliformis geosporum]